MTYPTDAAANASIPATGGSVTSPPVGDLAQATLAVSAEGDQVGPSGSPSAGLDLATLQQMAAMAEGRAPIPGDPQAQAPANQYQAPTPGVQSPTEVQPPAVQSSSVEQQLAVLQAQMQAQQAWFMEQMRAQQAQQQPQVDYAAQRAQEIAAAGLDPKNPQAIALYDLYQQNQQMAQRYAAMEQRFEALQQRAQVYTVQTQVGGQVDAAFAQMGVSNVPAETRQHALEVATSLALRGDPQAVERALAPIRAVINQMRAQAPRAPTLVPAPNGAPSPLAAVAVEGRGAGRSPRPATLDDITKFVSR